MAPKTVRYVLATAALMAIAIPSVAVGWGEGRHLRLGERNPSQSAKRSLSSETEIIASSETYGTRQSNKRDGDGGGAIYGCRSSLGNEPCVRAINLKGGRAFEFDTVGKEGGYIEVGDPSGAPLTTNATGVAKNFNADKVDGREAADFASAGDLLFAAVDVTGKLGAERGAKDAKLVDATKGTYSVTFDREVKACSFTASPVGGSTPVALGVQPADDASTVLVDGPDDADARRGFHLQVIC